MSTEGRFVCVGLSQECFYGLPDCRMAVSQIPGLIQCQRDVGSNIYISEGLG